MPSAAPRASRRQLLPSFSTSSGSPTPSEPTGSASFWGHPETRTLGELLIHRHGLGSSRLTS
jgi:hypothetical protein